ncbi:MAG: NAD(P)/FAD-dependent oxidoreductase [Planktomarina sp.]
MAQKIIIIGGGIIGAATAYHLSRQGTQVTVLDAGQGRATAASFGWVNASYSANEDHFHLRVAGLQAWAKMIADFGLQPEGRGSIAWDQDADGLMAQHKQLSDLGYPVEVLSSAEFQQLEPAIVSPPDISLRFPSELVVDANHAVGDLLKRSGAMVFRGVHVERIEETAVGPIVKTALGDLPADQVIVAAGTGTEDLLSGFETSPPLKSSPTLVVTTDAVEKVSSHVLASPVGDIRQRADGAFIMPTDIGHQSSETDLSGVDLQDTVDDAMHRLCGLFPHLDLSPAAMNLAWRPMPVDGLPIVGRITDRIYTAVMHSGVTLGAVMGELVADEVIHGSTNRTQSFLSAYRPDRF